MNKKLTKPYDLWRTGVTTDGFTPKGAIIMAVSVLLYGIIQVGVQHPSFNQPRSACESAAICKAHVDHFPAEQNAELPCTQPGCSVACAFDRSP